jgi:excisionase family DNA binding protein
MPLLLLTIADVAERLRLSERSVRRLIARGDLPARRIGSTRQIRVAVADVDRLLRPVGDAAGDLDSFINQATA